MSLSALEQALQLVEARIKLLCPDPVSTGNPLTFAIGAREVTAQLTPQRVTWVRTIDTFEPPMTVGGNPRALVGRRCGVTAHVLGLAEPARGWDTDDAATEALVEAVVAALHLVLTRGSYDLADINWKDFEWSGDGAVALVSFVIRRPVTAVPRATVTSTTTATDPSPAIAPAAGDLTGP